MIAPDLQTVKLYLRAGATDMRAGMRALAVLVEADLGLDPFAPALYLFASRDRRMLKILWWDRTGFCLWMKRLEADRFPWPEGGGRETREINREELFFLLSGIDFFRAHRERHYRAVS